MRSAFCARVVVASTFIVAAALVVRTQQPTFRATANLVRLDVSVLDKKGEPVRGLTQPDFAVFENGKPQSIEAFQAIDLPDTAALPVARPPADWLVTAPHDVATNHADVHRLFVIVMDDATIVQDEGVAERARDAARSVIAKVGSNDLATVVFTRRDNLHMQDFTSDRARLLDAVEAFDVGTDMNFPDVPCASVLSAARTLDATANYLTAAPEQRKALVYISSSLSLQLGLPGGCSDQLNPLMEAAFVAAQQANVNIYPIDACGLRTSAPPPIADTQPCIERLQTPTLHSEFLRAIAANTGGEADVLTNDVDSFIARMFRRNSSYSLIGYSPSDTTPDGKLRAIDVKVPGRRGLEISTRKSYYAPDGAKAAKTAPSRLPEHAKLLTGVLPDADIALAMTAAPFKLDDKTATVGLVLAITRPATSPSRSDVVDVIAGAFTPEGRSVAATQRSIRVTAPPPADGVLHYEIVTQVAVPPGRYEMRASVHSSAAARDGSVYDDIDIPDFAKAALSLSGVVLSVLPAPPAATTNAKATTANPSTVPPTTQRTFNRSDH